METTTEPKKTESRFKRPALADELDTMMVVVKPKGWLAVYSGLAILALIIIWAFVGKIPIIVSGMALSLGSEGTYVVVAQTEGTVVEILAHEGQMIEQGQILFKIIDPISQLAIASQQQKIDIAENNLSELRAKIALEDKAHGEALLKKIASEKYSLANIENTIPYLEKDLESKIRLNKEGIISMPDVEKARAALRTTQNDVEQHKANIQSFEADYATTYREGEIKAAEISLFEYKKQLERLQLERTFLEIRSERQGILLEVLVSNGSRVKLGAVVATIELPLGKEQWLRFYAAVGGEYGVLLKKGLTVQVEVAGVDPKQYGYLLGTIDYVSPYPVSTAEITAAVANTELASFLKGGLEAVYAVSIKLIPDPNTQSGLKWTTRYGPPRQISTGTLAVARVVVQEKRPIFYIIPEEIGPYVQEFLPHPDTP